MRRSRPAVLAAVAALCLVGAAPDAAGAAASVAPRADVTVASCSDTAEVTATNPPGPVCVGPGEQPASRPAGGSRWHFVSDGAVPSTRDKLAVALLVALLLSVASTLPRRRRGTGPSRSASRPTIPPVRSGGR